MQSPSIQMLTICGISELSDQRERSVTHVLSILDPDHPDPEAFEAYDRHHRTILRFHDIINPIPGMILPAAGACGGDSALRRRGGGKAHEPRRAICSSIATWACRARQPRC